MLTDLLNRQIFTLGGTPVTLGTLVTALGIILVSVWVSRLLQRALTRTLQRRGLAAQGSLAAGRRLVHYAVMLVGSASALETIGIDLAALFTAGAIVAVGVGFAMQNIAQNFVSGVILLVERSIKPGDVLEVEGAVVLVEEMGIRSTLVRTRNDEELIVPNTVLAQSTVKNYTLSDSLYRLRAAVGVAYESDVRAVSEALETMAEQLEWRATARPPRVLLLGFGDSSINFEVSVWIENPWDARGTLSDLHYAVWLALKDAGIVIAFPQLDVHLDETIIDGLGALTAGRPAA